MDQDRLRAAEAIFARAVQLTGVERQRFLEESCGERTDLMSLVEALLASDEELRSTRDLRVGASRDLDDEEPPWMSGRLVAGRFRVARVLGVGAAGRVYEATDEKLSRSVALKALFSGTLSGSRGRRRLERETLALSQLDHGHIASLFDVVTEEGLDVLVMEYVTGGTVRDRLQSGPIPIDDVERLGVELLEALEAAHGKNIVHGDLKPENLGISEYGALKVLDFGLAMILEDETTPSDPGRSLTRFVGTPAYMSPEQFLGSARSPATDLYAAGVVLYEMLTGERPADPVSGHPYNICLGARETPRPKTKRRDTPEALDLLTVRLLQHAANARPESARAAMEELRTPHRGKLIPTLPRIPAWGWIGAAFLGLAALAQFAGPGLEPRSLLPSSFARGSVSGPPRVAEVDFRDEFDSPVSFREPPGYMILNPDSSLWVAGQEPGFLSLVTHHADTWEGRPPRGMVSSPFSRSPRNVVCRLVPSTPFQISATIDSFWPTVDYQQAGIVVTTDSTFNNCFRITAAFGAGTQKAQAVFERNGDPIESNVNISRDASAPIIDLKLRIIYDGTAWRAEYRDPRKYNWFSILVVESRPGDWVPTYGGLTAFHGNMYDSDAPDRTPSPIPPCTVKFTSLEIEPYPPKSSVEIAEDRRGP